MKERPILFSAPMVRAILEGRKTQTRRIVKPQPEPAARGGYDWPSKLCRSMVSVRDMVSLGPYGYRGDRLWVREAFTYITGNGIRPHYRADGEPLDREGRVLPTEPGLRRWFPSIHMPRKLSRISLDIIGVRVERLWSITDSDALAEGVFDEEAGWHKEKFRSLWTEINGIESWPSNPWVWVVEFRRAEALERAA